MSKTVLESIAHLDSAMSDCQSALAQKGIVMEEKPAADQIAEKISAIPVLENPEELKQKVDTNTADIATIKSTYAKKEEVANLGDLKGACLKSELESKKAECQANDMYIVTDDNNHIWYYTGTEFIDTAAKCDVDLTPYLKSADAEAKYATTEQLAAKADSSALSGYATTDTVNGLTSRISTLENQTANINSTLTSLV